MGPKKQGYFLRVYKETEPIEGWAPVYDRDGELCYMEAPKAEPFVVEGQEHLDLFITKSLDKNHLHYVMTEGRTGRRLFQKPKKKDVIALATEFFKNPPEWFPGLIEDTLDREGLSPRHAQCPDYIPVEQRRIAQNWT